MSVVLSYADMDTAIIASDGRAVDEYNNPVFEDFKKIRKINDRILIGFSGDANACKNISNIITKPENKDYVSKLYVEGIIAFIEEMFKSAPPDLNCGFIVSGISENGKICTGSISTNQEKEIRFPRKDVPIYYGLSPKEVTAEMDIYRGFLLSQPPKTAIISTIRLCAKLSPSVNEVIFLDSVHLHG